MDLKILNGKKIKLIDLITNEEVDFNNLIFDELSSNFNSYTFESSYLPLTLTNNEINDLIINQEYVGEKYKLKLI